MNEYVTADDLKQIFKRIEKLEKEVFDSDKKGEAIKEKRAALQKNNIDFSLNERAFIKRYASGKSGPKKFALLLTYLVKGDTEKDIKLSMIKKHWNKMTAKTLLGKFNRFYPNEAKTRGWVNSKERGSYFLTNEWKNIQ